MGRRGRRHPPAAVRLRLITGAAPEHLGQKAALDFYRGVDDVQCAYLCPPGRIGPGERTGAYRVGEDDLLTDENGESDAISMEDYAMAVLDEADEPRHVGRRFTVAY